jgi:virginiamycin A acetyltransferase
MPPATNMREGIRSPCAFALLRLYERITSETIRLRLRNLAMNLEGGPAHSLTIREIFRRFYHVEVGLYTPGPCRLKPTMFHRGTSFGRHACIASTVRTFTRNHPLNTRSSHAVFYNPALGVARAGPVQFGIQAIGHGVWIGHNAIILPPAESIGDGAIITAGSVVYTNVPPYAIVSGFPARVTGYRFSTEVITELLASKWWERTPEELYSRNYNVRGTFLDRQHCSPRNTQVIS